MTVIEPPTSQVPIFDDTPASRTPYLRPPPKSSLALWPPPLATPTALSDSLTHVAQPAGEGVVVPVNIVPQLWLVIRIPVKANGLLPPPPPVVADDDDDNPVDIPTTPLHDVAGMPDFLSTP